MSELIRLTCERCHTMIALPAIPASESLLLGFYEDHIRHVDVETLVRKWEDETCGD